MKKKIFFLFISMFLPIFLFAKDESTMYWEKEIDVDGYVLPKMNLDFFIKANKVV